MEAWREREDGDWRPRAREWEKGLPLRVREASCENKAEEGEEYLPGVDRARREFGQEMEARRERGDEAW